MKPHRIIARAGQSQPVMERLESRLCLSAALTNITVNVVGDQIDPIGANTISLRDAILAANASKTPMTIGFSPGVFAKAQTIHLSGSCLTLSNVREPVSIVGPPAGVIIDAAGTNGGIAIGVAVAVNLTGIAVTGSKASAAIVNDGTLTLTNSTLFSNSGRALINGGKGTTTLLDDTLSGNSSNGNGGGAIANYNGILTLTNSTVADNSATGYGGGIFNYGGKVYLYDDTIADNFSATFGGGVADYAGGVTTIANTIIAANSVARSGQAPDVYGKVSSKGYNLIARSDGSSGWVGADLTGTVALPRDAGLGSLANNGGFTNTMMPLPDSPAINAGGSALVPAGLTTDQHGQSRFASGCVDIGAVEHSTVAITTLYGDELVITAAGNVDTIAVLQSGSTLTITADGVTSVAAAPSGGVFVYTRGGHDSVSIASSVSVQTTIDSIDNATTSISSFGAHVIAWTDSSDSVSGTASVHRVAAFAGGVGKGLGASLPNPTDSGATTKIYLSLFGAGPVAGDVNQGQTGDCYFLAALAGFAAQQPQLIRNSVADLGDGTYAVEFYSNGTPVFVRVNSAFSVNKAGGCNFAHPGADDTIWAMVMEKAFAWFRTGANTYNSIGEGWMSEAFADLNAPYIDFGPWVFSDSQLYNMFDFDLKNAEPIVLATIPSAPDLVSGHVYTLIGLQKVHGVNEYIIRNPWGESGDKFENSQGIAALTYAQLIANCQEAVAGGTEMVIA